MGFCKHCNKWIAQPEGKRKKEFCNNTCRSNFWYGKNKKGKNMTAKIQDLNQQTNVVKPVEQPKSNFQIDTTQKVVPAVRMPKTAAQYMKEKLELENEDQYRDWLAELEADPYLGRKQKDLIKSSNPSTL